MGLRVKSIFVMTIFFVGFELVYCWNLICILELHPTDEYGLGLL